MTLLLLPPPVMAHRQVVVEDEAGHEAVDVQRHTQQTACLHGRWRAKRRPQEAPERHTPPQPAAAPEAHSRRGSCTLEEEPPGRESETGSVPRPGPGDDGGSGLEGNGARGKSCLRGALGTLIGKRGGILTVL